MTDKDYNYMAITQRTHGALFLIRGLVDQPPELCLAAVTVHPYSLEWVHEQNQTYAMCKIAVSFNHRLLQYVAPRLLTAELCEIAMAQWHARGQEKLKSCTCNSITRYAGCLCQCPLRWIPAELQTTEMCTAALLHSATAFEFIHNKTPDLCRIAVSRDGMTLQFIEGQTPDLCRIAVEQTPRAIQYVTDQTQELCWMAVEKEPRTIQYVKNQTPALCELAMRKNPDVIEFISVQTMEVLALVPHEKRKFIKHRYYVRRSYVYKCVEGQEDVCVGCLAGESESESSSDS